MYKEFGKSTSKPLVVIHGGAGPREGRDEFWQGLRQQLLETAEKYWQPLLQGQSASEAAIAIVQELERLEDFNAGKGAFLQNDGVARLSASLMDGETQVFSGVHLATNIIHPTILCQQLQRKKYRVLGPYGAQLLARELGIKAESPVTLAQVDRWRTAIEGQKEIVEKGGTVGAVVLDSLGRLAAVTSTGGDVQNPPERMSDSATVAGNYASMYAAISCTGVGEQIVDDAVSARIETRVRDGRSVIEASELCWKEGQERAREYGWIGIDKDGNWSVCNLREDMSAVVMSADMKEVLVLNA